MLLEEFSVIFDRPEKVKKLREYILSLAVRGKLVEQDKNDESAHMLLDRIKEEKDRLIKEKKIKKEKPLPEINVCEITHELPKGWVWIRLGELGNIFNGNSINAKLKESKYSNIKEGYNYIATKDIDLQSKIINYENGIKIPYDEEKFRIAHKGAILICAEGGSAGKKIGLVDEDICFGNKLLAIELFYKTNSKYLFYVYQSPDFFEKFSSLMTGIIGGISSKNFKEILVPLPPLKEQKRIVEKVDYLMSFCDKLEKQLEIKVKYGSLSTKSILNNISNCRTYDELKESLVFIIDNFKDLTLTDGAIDELKNAILSLAVKGKLVPQYKTDESASELLVRIKEEKNRLVKEKIIKKEKSFQEIREDEISYELPKGWDKSKLGCIAFITKLAGFEYTKYIQLKDEGEVPVLRAQNIRMVNIDKSNLKYIDYQTSLDLPRSALTKKCLVMTFIGAGIGDVSLFDEDIRYHLAPNVAKIELYTSDIDERYLLYYLISPIGRREIFKHLKATAQPSLSMQTIRDANIILPPLNEQKRIVEKVDKLMKVCNELELTIEKYKKYSKKLMESILKDNFKA